MIRRHILTGLLLLTLLILFFILDQSIRSLIFPARIALGMKVMGLISDAGSWASLSAVAMLIWIWGVRRKDKRIDIGGRYALISVLGSRLIVEIIKHLAGRPRPGVSDSEGFRIGISFAEGYDSFPSGHAASSFAFAYILAQIYPGKGYIFYTGATIISFSRIYLDAHFASDIFAGCLIGLASSMTLYNYMETGRKRLKLFSSR